MPSPSLLTQQFQPSQVCSAAAQAQLLQAVIASRQPQNQVPPPPPYTPRPTPPPHSHNMAQPSSFNNSGINPLFAPPRQNQSQGQPMSQAAAVNAFFAPQSNTVSPHASPPKPDDDDDDEEDEGEDSPLSTITISISTPISIVGNNNHLAFDPASAGAMLGKGLIDALKGGSTSGIPMIDQDGRPRPIHVRIASGVEIRGVGNRIGREVAGVARLVALQEAQTKKVAEVAMNGEVKLQHLDNGNGMKRGRDESEESGDGVDGERQSKSPKISEDFILT